MTNRSIESPTRLVTKMGRTVIDFKRLHAYLAQTKIVVMATASTRLFISRDSVGVCRKRAF